MKGLFDTWLVYRRYMLLFLRNPAWIAIGILQPVLYLVLFAPLLKSIASMPGFPPGGAYNVFVPGLLVQLGLFGAVGVGFGLIAELREGVIERLRVTPVSRTALLLGRAGRDMTTLVLQGAAIVVLSLPFGLNVTWEGLLVMLALLALIGLLFASLAYTIALRLKSEDAYAAMMSSSTLPLLLLSGVLLPLSLAPAWLRFLGNLNPLTYAVNAGRTIFRNQLAEQSVFIGVALFAVLALAASALAVRSFSRAVA